MTNFAEIRNQEKEVAQGKLSERSCTVIPLKPHIPERMFLTLQWSMLPNQLGLNCSSGHLSSPSARSPKGASTHTISTVKLRLRITFAHPVSLMFSFPPGVSSVTSSEARWPRKSSPMARTSSCNLALRRRSAQSWMLRMTMANTFELCSKPQHSPRGIQGQKF